MKDEISPSPLALSIKVSTQRRKKNKRLLSFNCIHTVGDKNNDDDMEPGEINECKGEDDYKIKIKSKIKNVGDNPVMSKIRENIMENREEKMCTRKISNLNYFKKNDVSEDDLYEIEELRGAQYDVDKEEYNDDDFFLEMSEDDGANEKNEKSKGNESEEDPEEQDLAILDVLKKANRKIVK